MDNVIIWGIRTFTCLLLINRGSANSNVIDKKYVTVLKNVKAWSGSCVLLPCTHSYPEVIKNYTWLYNPAYKEDDFTGKIVYNSLKMTRLDSLFEGNVIYFGKTENDCTILIKNLTDQHSGQYGLRLRKDNPAFKWMSKTYVNVTVSDAGPSFGIESVPEITESQFVTLTCSIKYYCPLYTINLTWIEDVNGTTKTEIKHDTGDVNTKTSLTFCPSWTDHNKTITCLFHQRDREKIESKSIQLNVKYAPKNVKIWSNNSKTFEERESITLECSVEASNPPVHSFRWYKNGGQVYPSANTITVKVAGKYQCEAENSVAQTKSEVVEISMLYAPKNTNIKTEGKIVEGETVTLTCSTYANPQVSLYIWYKNGNQCFNSTNSKYRLNTITTYASGTYMCEATNKLGSKISAPLEVDVMYPPKEVKIVLEPNSKTFREGTKVKFACVAGSSNPSVTNIVWSKDNKTLWTFSEQMSIRAQDSGMYSCQAGNNIGASMSPAISMEVLYPPKEAQIRIVKGSEVKEGDQIALQCSVHHGNPEISNYEWIKDGKLYKSTADSDVLSINLTWKDSGYYSCSVSNKIGNSVSDSSFLNVQYAPRNVTLSITPGTHVTEYTDVKMTCKAQSNPQKSLYLLYRDGQVIKLNEDLFLVNIQRSNGGEYHCSAKNSVGQQNSEFVHLYVSYSWHTIGIYVSSVLGSLIFIIILVILIVRFRVWKKNCRKTVDDTSFFVLKKSHNENQAGQDTPSANSSTDQLNYSTLQLPAGNNRLINHPGAERNQEDISTIYSVVKKFPTTAEYENIQSSKKVHEGTQDDIHYSVIANLPKEGTQRKPGPEVEYAMLRH